MYWNIFIFPRKQDLMFHANCLSIRDNLHEMPNPVFWEKQEKYNQLLSTELTKSGKS